MFATQVLPEERLEDESKEETNIQLVGFLIVDNKQFEVKKGENMIGRDSSVCSIVIENFTISKVHAVIESDGIDETFIYDVGSTNQTKLGKKALKPHFRYKLDNGMLITLGNIIAKFVFPSVIEEASKSNQVLTPSVPDENVTGCDVLNELGDIFDIATQIDSPQPSTSKTMTKFEMVPDNFQLFKVPSPVACSEKSKICSETTWNQINLKRSPQSFIEDPSIFSLTTQCQLPENLALTEPSENSDADKLKSLLSDGEDDVLCNVMASHSPNGNFLHKRIKTEVIDVSLDEIFDCPTQVAFKSKDGVVKQEVHTESSEKDCHVIKQELADNPTQPFVEEKTAEVQDDENARGQEKNLKSAQENVSQHSSESYLEITLDDIEVEGDEDLILTQKFEKSKESHEEDLDETQIYDVKNIRRPEVVENVSKFPSLVVVESSDDDTASDLEISVPGSTQRNKDEDYISTQAFGSRQITLTEPVEDFIATQIREEPERNNSRERQFTLTEPVEDFIATQIREEPERNNSRESSPDLLSSCSQNRAEDFICTQAFESEQPKRDNRTDTIESILFRRFGVRENDEPRVENKVPPSSGDETESDLEIILSEPPSGINVKKESRDDVWKGDGFHDDGSNSSYIFQLEQTQVETAKNVMVDSDSDATDCEEICAININTLLPCKKEDETFEGCAEKEESPKPELVNSLEEEINHSLAFVIAETQEVDTVTEIGNEVKSSSCIGSKTITEDTKPKRVRTKSFTEVVPTKKCRNTQNVEPSPERRLTRLWQTHDMSHVQTTRTRNSKNLEETESPTNVKKRPPSRRKNSSGKTRNENRKSVCDSRTTMEEDFIMKPNSPEIKNVSRILRSARRKSVGLAPVNLFDSSLSSSSIRSGLRRNCRTRSGFVNVVFTGFECERLEKIITELGGRKSQDLSEGQVVVTDKVRRTVKFLCAVGLGLPVASPKWLLACREENRFLDPWDYILRDEESEEKWDFDLRWSLERAKKTKLLQGFSVYATESTKPPVRDLLAIVECCGGVPLFEKPKIWPKKTVVVSCEEDKDSWPPPKIRHVKIVHYEFILSGALKQKIDFKTYSLK